MKDQARGLEARESASWLGWCCPYCAAALDTRPHGLYCTAEGRWFATTRGVHRLLTEERRRELLPFLELYQRVRRDQGWKVEPGLPYVAPEHKHAAIWNVRAARFRSGIELATGILGRGPWRVLDVGAGSCWASARLWERGHRVVAVDMNLDPDDGLVAAEQLMADPSVIARAEAEMDALPLEPGLFDLVLVAGSLHHAPRLVRALVELRRVTRRGGLMLVLDSPVYRRRQDGEAMVAARMKELGERYRLAVPRESQSGYLVLGELPDAFSSGGWKVEVHGWPSRLREKVRDTVERARWGRRGARFPILLARRDG